MGPLSAHYPSVPTTSVAEKPPQAPPEENALVVLRDIARRTIEESVARREEAQTTPQEGTAERGGRGRSVRVFLRGGVDKVRRRGVSVCGCLRYCAGQSRVDGEGATAHRRSVSGDYSVCRMTWCLAAAEVFVRVFVRAKSAAIIM